MDHSTHITYSQMLQQMKQLDKNREPMIFSLSWVSCSLSNNTGGEIISMDNMVWGKMMKKAPGFIKKDSVVSNGKSNNNDRINLVYLPTGRFFSVHTRLITSFNNLKVLL